MVNRKAVAPNSDSAGRSGIFHDASSVLEVAPKRLRKGLDAAGETCVAHPPRFATPLTGVAVPSQTMISSSLLRKTLAVFLPSLVVAHLSADTVDIKNGARI